MRIVVNDFAGHAFPLQLSRELSRIGHEVLHLYFAENNTPKGRTDIGDGDSARLSIEPIHIAGVFRKHSVLTRRSADLAYGRAARQRILSFEPDVVISGNTPLDAQKIILKGAHNCGAAFVFWLQDVLSTGIEFVLRRKRVPFAGLAGRLYRHVERNLLLASDAVVCIAPEFVETLHDWKLPTAATFTVENWAPLNEIKLVSRPTDWALEQGLGGKFCFLYSGTLGMKHNPKLLLDLAQHFQKDERVVTVVVAEGAGANWLRSNSNKLRPGALVTLPFQPYARLSEVLASGDVLISLLDDECGNFAVPSKTLAYLCAGRPLLIAAPWHNLAARIVRRADAGEAVSSESVDFIGAAVRMMSDARARSRYAANARKYAERTFRIENIAERFVDICEFAMESTQGTPVGEEFVLTAGE